MKLSAPHVEKAGKRIQKSATGPDKNRKTVTKNLRIDSNVSALIEQAAVSCGTTFTSFVLEAAAARAERHLLDKCFITVDANSFAEIEALLAMAHQPTNRLKSLFNSRDSELDASDRNDNFAEVRLAP
jgi:uncharacterized protein (DUF1778 family)